MKRLQRGDYVRVRRFATDEWFEAFVALASGSNPSSVMLMGDGLVRAASGYFIGALPLSIDYDKETATGLDGASYEMEVRADAA